MAGSAQDLLFFTFAQPDAAAAPGGAILTPVGVPDLADQTTGRVGLFGAPGSVYGVQLQGAPASGDTVTVNVQINGNNTSAQVVINNASPRVVLLLPVPVPFPGGSEVGVIYTTTTSGAYTVKDIACQALIGLAVPPVGMSIV